MYRVRLLLGKLQQHCWWRGNLVGAGCLSPLVNCCQGAGLKRAFHARHQEGLLSGRGLRILDFCCDSALDEPGRQLDLWQRVEKEVGGVKRGRGGLECPPIMLR